MRKIFLALFLTIAVATVGHSFPIVSYVQISTGGTQAGGFNTQLGTVGSLTVTDLNANRCVQTGPGGTLAVSDNQCGNGGVLTSSAILVITQNQVAVSSPALNLNILSPPLLVSLTGSATGTLTVDPSSVTLLGNIFQSTNVWKGGNTYQSSMTVNGLTSFNNSVQFKNVEAQFFNGAGENSVQILNPGAAGTHLLQLNAAGGGLGINQTPVTGRDLTLASIAVNGLTTGQCVQVGTGGLLTTTGAGCIAGSASSGHINASTQAYIPYYSTPGSTNTLSGSPGISVTTFTTTGAGPGQIALREGDRQNVKNVGLGAFVIWNDLATHTAMFNSAGGSSQTLVGVSGVTTNGHMAVMNGSNIVDYGDFPSMPRYELQPATITPHLDAGLQGTFATLTSTISLPYIVKTTYNNTSSMTATGTYFDLSGSTMANVLVKTPINIYQGASGTNTSEIDFTNVLNNNNSSLAQRWYAGTGFNYPLILNNSLPTDTTKNIALWIDPTNGVTVVSGSNTTNAFSIGPINGPYSFSVSTQSQTALISTGSLSALKITANGTYGTTNGSSGGLFMNCTGGGAFSGNCVQLYSNAGAQNALGGMFNIVNDSSTWNEPEIYTQRTNNTNNNSDIRIEATGTPAISILETGQSQGSAKKFQWSVHNGTQRFEGRNTSDNAFDSQIIISSMASYGDVAIGSGYNSATNTQLQVISSTSNVYDTVYGTSTTSGLYAVAITTSNHISFAGVLPSTSSCGTGAGFIGTDADGVITPGTAAGGCTVTFSQRYTNAPSCIVTERTMSLVNVLSYSVTASALTISQTSLTSILDYHCSGIRE